jgi:Beta-galactosidase.
MRHCFLPAFLFVFLSLHTQAQEGKGVYKNRTFFHLERYWDSAKVCNNPHKGWFIHYYDNSISNYGDRMAPNDSLPDFPGLNDIYLRLAWCYLEPEEGKYNWQLLDSIINRWVGWGHTISFRITCKETNGPPYATPAWVEKAGAKGKMIQGGKAWAPDYGDPVFLKKLENFHKAFAARYDGKPWVEYIDIGSIGEWGEGHTAFSGWEDVPLAVVKQHIDMYKRCYKKSVLLISDDFIGQRDTDDLADYAIYHYCLQRGIGFRDDSGNVRWYRQLGFGPSCIRSPELYSKVYKNIPVVLESDHYSDAVQNDMWKDGAGFEKAIHETHATYIGFHHYPREWLLENEALAGRLANLSGYWYFPKFAMMPDTFRIHSNRNYLRMTWENHGVAPAYHRYKLYVQLIHQKNGKAFSQELTESDNRTWLPDEIVAEQYKIDIDKNMDMGKYDLLINMRDACGFHNRNIQLPLKKERETVPGWYKLGEVTVH